MVPSETLSASASKAPIPSTINRIDMKHTATDVDINEIMPRISSYASTADVNSATIVALEVTRDSHRLRGRKV